MVGVDSDWRRCFGKAILVLGRLIGLGLGLALSACATGGPSPEAPTPERAAGLPGAIRLVGLDGSELEGLLGQPSLVRSEQSAQYRRYSLGSCQLDLFLYAERDAGPARVVYLDVRPTGYVTPARAASCAELAPLLRGQPMPPPLGPHAESVDLPTTSRP